MYLSCKDITIFSVVSPYSMNNCFLMFFSVKTLTIRLFKGFLRAQIAVKLDFAGLDGIVI